MTDLHIRLASALEGRYVLDHEIGAGGMATVYLARDVRHEREVALKVLKPELSAVMGGERFLSEIRTTANLQHPHILPLYDSGNADGLLFYVMPYVEGESLRDRLAREKQLPVDEAIRIAKAVAGALDFAHRKGVVHRDIKPANILLQDEQPLVSDFGIALAVAQAGGGRLTETGLSLGTPHYMSPEQASADRDPDARSDVYSLACVVYEMLSGEPPYLGNSVQAVLARILTETARPIRDVRSTVPAHVEAALGKALQKLPADRFDTAAEFTAALEGRMAVDTVATAALAAGGAGAGAGRPWLWPAVAGGALVAGLGGGWLAHAPAPRPAPPPVIRLYVQGDSTFSVTNECCGPSIAISPDGTRLVFMARTKEGSVVFYRRDLDDTEAHAVPGTDGAHTPFLSPDGRWLGFAKDGALMKTDLEGGAPLTLAQVGASRVHGATWADDGNVYYTPAADGPEALYRVSAQGGEAKLVAAPDTAADELGLVTPSALPGGNGILYVSWPREGGDDKARVGVLDPRDGSTRVLTQGIQPYYSATGHLVYALADGTVMARPFDPASIALAGEPVRIADKAITHDYSDTEYAVSRSGTVVTRQGGGSTPLIRRYSMDGAMVGVFNSELPRFAPAFSPDGRRLAFSQVTGTAETWAGADVWVLDLDTRLDTRLSSGGGWNTNPIWSADGKSLRWSVFEIGTVGLSGGTLMTRPADLSGPAEPFTDGAEGLLGLPSRSGGPIPLTVDSAGSDLWVIDADGSNPRPFLRTPFNERDPAVSPSGKWVAYTSDETGRDEVYVQPFPAGGARYRISPNWGDQPRWVSDTRILYLSQEVATLADLDDAADAVRVTGYHTIKDLVTVGLGGLRNLRALDVSPDGKLFAVVAVTGTSRLLVETNRLQELAGR